MSTTNKNSESTERDYPGIDFPNVIEGVAGDFASLYSNYLESPPEFFSTCFLTCLGNVISGFVTLESELSPQPRIYLVITGESADDRKSTAINKTFDFFQEVDPYMSICRGVGSAEGLQSQLDENSNSILALDEFKQFVSKSRIDSSVLLPCVNTLFESNSYANRTKQSSIVLENVHLSMIAASTLDTFESMWDSSFTNIGFNNRLFLVPGSSTKKIAFPKMIPEVLKIPIKDKLNQILGVLDSSTPPLRIPMDNDAAQLYEDWYRNFSRSIHTKRIDTYSLRFMILFAVNENKFIVDKEIVEKVILLMDWQLKMRQIYDPIDADNVIAKMEGKIRRQLSNQDLTDRELKQKTHYHRVGTHIYNYAIKNLENSDEIYYDRDTDRWVLIE